MYYNIYLQLKKINLLLVKKKAASKDLPFLKLLQITKEKYYSLRILGNTLYK